MKFKFHIGTRAYFGKGCIAEHGAEIARYGKKAFIITGASSGKQSGALDEIIRLLTEEGIGYTVFDSIRNNPTLQNVGEAASAAREFGPDFIVGIGGGSPIDAAKAAAVLAANDMEPTELYNNIFTNNPLPVIAIPTTAGTGSEVTPYSVLTRVDMETKMSFGNESTFPKIAYLDPEYTKSMPYNIAVYTAIDALSHAVEGYLNKRCTPVGDVLALEAIELFGQCIEGMTTGQIGEVEREKLLYASMLGGMVIAHSGTSIVHGMGYSLTYYRGVQHGMANGLLMSEYLRYNYPAVGSKIDKIIFSLGLKDIDEFDNTMKKLLRNDIKLNSDECALFAEKTMKQRSTAYNSRSVKEADINEMFKRSLGI